MNEIISTQMRIPRHLRDWLKKSGKQNNRSMNAELVNVLETAKAKELEKKLEEKLI